MAADTRGGISAGQILTALGVLLAGVLGVWLYTTDWYERKIDAGYSADALRNPYLAAHRYVESLGVPLHAGDDLRLLDSLPDTDAVLIMSGSRRALSQSRIDAVIDWVDRGGYLVLIAGSAWDEDLQSSDDPLLDALEVRAHGEDDAELPAFFRMMSQVVQDERFELCDVNPDTTSVNLAGEPELINVNFNSTLDLEYVGALEYGAAWNDTGAQLIYIERGAGAVMVMTSSGMWNNRSIGCLDHAHLLRWVAQEQRSVHWLFNVEMPPWYALLWMHWRLALLLSGIWLLLWFWRGNVRRFPPHETTLQPRRELLEHTTGMARFLAQNGDWAALLEPMQRDVLRARGVAEGHAPGPDGAIDAIYDELAEESGESIARVRWVLTTDFSSTRVQPRELEQITRVLQKLTRTVRAGRRV